MEAVRDKDVHIVGLGLRVTAGPRERLGVMTGKHFAFLDRTPALIQNPALIAEDLVDLFHETAS